jgi:hypothetical protein
MIFIDMPTGLLSGLVIKLFLVRIPHLPCLSTTADSHQNGCIYRERYRGKADPILNWHLAIHKAFASFQRPAQTWSHPNFLKSGRAYCIRNRTRMVSSLANIRIRAYPPFMVSASTTSTVPSHRKDRAPIRIRVFARRMKTSSTP